MFQVMKLLLVGFLVVLVALPIIHANIDTISCTAEDGTTKIIPISKVNDNYCDCPVNGEDEPDTSACAHTVQQFICNGDVDHKTIPLSFVTDGVCDCCDGTDEVAGACKNTCEEERINKVKKTQAEIDLHLKGETFKKKYIKQGKEGVKKLDASVKQLKKETKLEEEELQSKIYGSPPTNQQVLQKMYSALMQKKQQLSVIEKLSDSPLVFGGLREYYPLLGKCFKHKSNEKQFKGGSFEHVAKDFIFEVCPFSSIVQHDVDEPEKKPTLLGFFQNWDEEVDNIMIFSGGDECWNGPNRVVRMEVVCGSEDALVDVKENGKCTYEFVFKTPAACNKKHADKLKKYIKKISPPEPEIVHDEL